MPTGRRQKFVWILSLSAVVGSAAYFGLGRFPVGRAQSSNSPLNSASTKQAEPIAVTTTPVTLRSIERTVNIVGTLRGFDEIEVGAIVDGRVSRILHEVGDVVRPGELLLEVDDGDYRLAVEEMAKALDLELSRLGLKQLPGNEFDVRSLPAVLRAEIVERNAAGTLERYSKLVGQNAITKDDIEKAELNLRTAELDVKQRLLEVEQTLASVRHRAAVLETARKKLRDARVVVPTATALAGEPRSQINLVSTAAVSGYSANAPAAIGALTVAERFVSEGEIVRAASASKLFRLVVEDPLKLQAAVPERFSGRMQVGQPVRVSVEAYPERTFQGVVARVNPTVDEASRTFAVEVSISNADRALKAGSFAVADVSTGRDDRAATVPEEAIVKFAGVTKVFVVDGTQVRAVPVELGTRLRTAAGNAETYWIEVRGIAADCDVVTAGHSQLSDGATVRSQSRARRRSVGDGRETGIEKGSSMTVWDVCIRRPIFTAMLVSAPIVLGLASYARLGVDLFPNVDLPVVVVTTTLRGASVEEMETGVTKPIEEIVNTVAGIEQMRSTTREGVSTVTIEFKLEKDGAIAAQEVDSKVRTILAQLPEGTDPPIIDKFAVDAAPVLTLAVSGRRDAREVTEIAKRRIKEDLESLPGVGAVILVGGRQRAVQITVDTDKLQKYDRLTIEDVRQALIRENQEQPGGRIDQGPRELVLRTMGRVRAPADFADLIVANRGGQPIRISDLGRVEDSYEEPRGLSRLWSHPTDDAAIVADDAPGDTAVTLIVQKQSGTNTVKVVDAVKRRLDEIRTLLPADIETVVIRDQSRFIKNSIHEVQTHLMLAAVLVSLTILLFMRDWRTTLIATLSIPTSMIATFAFMDAMGFTLNNITMLGLILAIGIVVDDAVVVHENIFRHMEEYGLSAREAASSATKEIALAVVATTLSLLVIFLPIIFMGGRVGRFFMSFGYVVGFSILMSMFISFTMTPMLCSRFLKAEDGRKSKGGFIWRAVEGTYLAVLGFSLRHRWLIVLTTVGVLASTPTLMAVVGKDFVPRDDQSEFEVSVTLPEGYTLDRADRVLGEVERRLRKLTGVTNTFLTIGDTTGRVTRGQGEVTRASIYCRLVDLKDREYSQFDVMAKARKILIDYPDLRAAVQDAAVFSGSGFRQVMIDLNIRGPDMDRLNVYSDKIAAWMKAEGHFVDVDTSLALRKPEVRILPNRERASELGVSIQTISSTANVLVGGDPVSKYKEADQQYDVWLRAEQKFRDDPSRIARLTVPSLKPSIGVVELGNVAKLVEAQGPSTIERFSRQRQVVVSANLEGKPLGEAVQQLGDFVRSLDLPSDYRWEFLGQAKNLNDTMANFLIAFGLAFLFMYMILAAQFESFVHPITILLALPLTVPFAILSLILLQTNLDIYAMFGLFMLFGIVKKNGILQVDYTNVLRERGMERDPAILEANATRLRPILMTTVMLVAAMVPMAMGEGPGAASRAGMAKVILGGQVLSLLLTLLVTPVAYSLWDDLTQWVRHLVGGTAAADPASPTGGYSLDDTAQAFMAVDPGRDQAAER